MQRSMIMVAAAALAFAGCSKKQDEAPPAKPANGAPVAFQVTKVVPGEAFKSELDVKAYNFSDKAIASYWVLVRFKDGDGKVVHGEPAVGSDHDFDHWSFSGGKYKCDPSSWCSLKLDPPVPASAKTAEVVAYSLSAVADDGLHIEQKPLFEMPKMEWPQT